MKQAVLSICSLCMIAALCLQFMGTSRFTGVVRIVLGLEIVAQVISLMDVVLNLPG